MVLERLQRFSNATAYSMRAASRYFHEVLFWDVSRVHDAQMERIHMLLNRRGITPLTLSEMRVYSQNGEDGVLWEIFSRIMGSPYQGKFVEIGANGRQSTALLLARLAGWSGAFFDKGVPQVRSLRRSFTGREDIEIVDCLVTAENFTNVVGSDLSEVDLLCIDVDGADIQLVERISQPPKVLVVEINSTPGLRSYRQNHGRTWDRTAEFGASIDVMDLACSNVGLTRVFVESTGTNAFYVRNEYLELFRNDQYGYTVVANYYGLSLQHPRMLFRKRLS